MDNDGKCACGCGETTTIYQRNRYGRGAVKGQHALYIRGHGRRKQGYVLGEVGDCWEWFGAHDEDGYGIAWRHNRKRPAHCVTYEERFGPIPKGIDLHHTCENKACVNPAHLEPMPKADHRRSHGRLTDQQRTEIRALRGVVSQTELGRRYGIAQSYVHKIQNSPS